MLLVHGFALTVAALSANPRATQVVDSLTIAQAVAHARAARPRAVAGGAAVGRALGAARRLAAVPNPTAQFESDHTAPTNKVTFSQSMAWLPRHGADVAAGRAAVDRARADSAQQLAEVGREVSRAFYGALAAERQLALAAEQGALADSLARLAARRAAAGDISDLERDQVALDASRARLTVAQTRETVERARVELARAIAWPATMSPRCVGRLDEALGDDAAVTLADGGIDAMPVVRGAVADSVAAAARLRGARIARVPVPGLIAGQEWGGGPDGRRNVILGFSLPLPLWSQGNEAVTEARGAAAEAAALAGEARLDTRARVASARVLLAERVRRARFARDSLFPEAQRVRAGAVRLYEAGRTSVVPVLDALRAERDVARLAVAEQLAFQEARADLAAALGQWP